MIQRDKVRVDIFSERSRTRASQLTLGLRVVTSYINGHREVVLEQTTMEITATLNTSDVTIIRAIQALEFTGLRDLKRILEQWLDPALSSSERVSAAVSNLTNDVNTAIGFILGGRLYVYNVLSEPEDRYAFARAVASLMQVRQTTISGISASGILADRAARLFNRIGLPATALDHTGIDLAEQLIALQRGDVLIMMAQKSAHREGLTALREARRLGIPVILLTDTLDSRFSKGASIVIHVPCGGEKEKTPLHGTVLLCLKMIIWSVASAASQRAIKTTKRISDFRRELEAGRKNG